MDKPALSQIESLVNAINKNENFQRHFYVELDECWRRLKDISDKEYKYMTYLLINKRMFMLNKKLVQLGFMRKTPIRDDETD